MHKSSVDNTSSISFTAYYTSHVWFANGLCGEAFHTRRGSVIYHALAPFEFVGKQLVGCDIKTDLLQRHYLLDHLVTGAIEHEGVEQVLEIACGLSPRGYYYCRHYPGLNYVETDLPGMAARKYQLLREKGLLSPNHRVAALDIFARHSADAMETVIDAQFDKSKPLLVISEGLVNYFSLATISFFWKRLQQSLAGFPLGIYLADNYPMLKEHPFCRTMRVLGLILGAASRSDVSFHFGSDEEGARFFRKLGFQRAGVHDPSAYYESLDIPRTRSTPFVRIIEARTGRTLQRR